MSQSYPARWEQCATCVYWAGSRDTDRFGDYVNVDSAMAKGKCMCRGSGWANKEMQASFSCQSYQKWPALK